MSGPDQWSKPSPRPEFPANAKRRASTQALVDSIVLLHGAVLPGEDRTHFYIAEGPISAGIKPLLLLIQGRDGKTEFRRVLAVLPSWGIRAKPLTSYLYKAAFSYVRAKYKTLINEVESEKLLKMLPVKLVDGRHNGNSIPFWLSEQLANFVAEAKENDVSTRLLSPISELLLPGSGGDDDEEWDVLHLDYREPDSAGDPNWYILENWEGWEARGLNSAERFASIIKSRPIKTLSTAGSRIWGFLYR